MSGDQVYSNTERNIMLSVLAIIVIAIVVFLFFLWQRKRWQGNVNSDQSVGTPQIQVTDSSVGESSVSVRDQSVGTPQIQVTDSSVGESSVSVKDQSIGTLQIQVTDSSVGESSVSVKDQSIGTLQIQVTDSSVGDTSVFVRDQDTSASTCCGAGIPRFLLSLPATQGPQSEMNVEEELNFPYVKAVREKNTEEAVPQERLEAAIRYLNTQEGGIQAHRSVVKLMCALQHMERMESSRMDNSEYTYHRLRHLLVEKNGYHFEDFERVLEEFRKTHDFLPSPVEFVELYYKMKGIVRLEEEVAEARQKLDETRQEAAQRTREVEDQMERTSQESQQALQQEREENERLRRQLQGERQKVLELEQNSDQELQRQAQRAKCKVCLDEEVRISFHPCRHVVACEGCAELLNQCPVCRKNIDVKNWVLLA